LQNNRKVSRRFWQLPARAGEFRKGGLFFLARSLFWPEIFKKFPVPASETSFARLHPPPAKIKYLAQIRPRTRATDFAEFVAKVAKPCDIIGYVAFSSSTATRWKVSERCISFSTFGCTSNHSPFCL